jgi:DNA polymerase V
MKASKLPYVKTNYKFEAPVIEAKIRKKRPLANNIRKSLDLNAYLAPDPENIFLVRVSGESMIDANIYDGDILVVDKAAKPGNGKIVIASLNGEMAVKYFRIIDGEAYLISANKKFTPIKINELFRFEIQGVVKHVIRDM